MVGAQAWQLSLCGAATQLAALGAAASMVLQSSGTPGSSPGHALGAGALAPGACPQPFCSSASLTQAAQNEDRRASCREILIPVLGQLLGRLLLLVSSGEEKTSRVALDALFSLFLFTRQQKGKRSSGGLPPPPLHNDINRAVCLSSCALWRALPVLAGGTTMSPAPPLPCS